MIKNMGASVRARLLTHARQHGDEYQRVLIRYATERLLFRLCQTEAADRFVLKGAMLLVTWPEHMFRPTRDLDLSGHGSPDPAAVARVFKRICQVQVPEDGIRFDGHSLRVQAVHEADKYQGAKLNLIGKLDRMVIPVRVDIGFGDHIHPPPKRGTFPGLLPNLPQANVLMYPPETVVSEKFEAMIRFGEANGRLKDFHDIWITTRTFPFDLPTLLEAVGGTLRHRETAIPTEMPVGLAKDFVAIVEDRGLWSAFLHSNPPTLKPPPFAELQEELRHFFGPIIAGLGAPEAANGRWDPDSRNWR